MLQAVPAIISWMVMHLAMELRPLTFRLKSSRFCVVIQEEDAQLDIRLCTLGAHLVSQVGNPIAHYRQKGVVQLSAIVTHFDVDVEHGH